MTDTNVPVIDVRHADKHFGKLHVLRDISLSVGKGEVVVIIGPSGSGKSTLCRTINRLETIDSGEILIEGVPMPQEGRQLLVKKAQIAGLTQEVTLPEEVAAPVAQGQQLGTLTVRGENLKLRTLTPEGGQVTVEGAVSALYYEEPKAGGFWRRLLG